MLECCKGICWVQRSGSVKEQPCETETLNSAENSSHLHQERSLSEANHISFDKQTVIPNFTGVVQGLRDCELSIRKWKYSRFMLNEC